MSKLPKVTIGLPVYNGGKTIAKAIAKLLEQTYENLEIIISDNCSTDSTEEEVRKFKDARIIYIKQELNLGSTGNFDFVLRKASGTFFMWHSHDDWLDNDYIETCVELLTKDDSISLVSGKAHYYDGEKFLKEGDITQFDEESPLERIKEYYRKVEDNGVFYGLMRLKDISKIELRNELADDWMTIAALANRGKILHLQRPNIHRALGGTSRSFKNIIQSLKLSKLYYIMPFFLISINAGLDVFRCKLYKKLNFFEKVSYSSQIFFVINLRIIKRRSKRALKLLIPGY